VTVLPDDLVPEPGERGRISTDLPGTLAATVAAWDSLIDAVSELDMGAPARKSGRTAARTLVVLGSWPEGRPLPAIRRDALDGIVSAEPLSAIEERVIATRVDAGSREIIDSLRRARDEVTEWSSSAAVSDEALLPVAGPLGVVPLGTLVAATAYQCAVAARDLAPAGVSAHDDLLAHGLAALVDTVGAVAAQQPTARDGSAGDGVSLTALTPQVRIATGCEGPDWRTVRVDQAIGPTLICDAGVLLDIASSRASAPAAYARGDLRAEDLGGLFAVAQVLARSPGLPGTEGLQAALQAYESSAAVARAVGGAVGSAWRRLRGG